jgi:gliding motility-associated-like protein
MNLTPSISLDGAYNINCYGESTGTIDVEPYNYVNYVNYLWSDLSTEGDRNSLPAGDYEVLIVDANNCRARSEITLTQPDPIIIEFEQINPYCPGSPDGEISAAASGGIPGYNYLWSNGSTGSIISNITNGIYSVTVTDMNLCSVIGTTDLISIWDHCLQIPNAISPNGDGLNEVWNLGFTEMYPMMEVRIFNNWGQLIWESARGYTHPWDGTSNGRPLPVDSYFYIINLNDGTEPVTGHVNIIK